MKAGQCWDKNLPARTTVYNNTSPYFLNLLLWSREASDIFISSDILSLSNTFKYNFMLCGCVVVSFI
jgi:hypothetical protein